MILSCMTILWTRLPRSSGPPDVIVQHLFGPVGRCLGVDHLIGLVRCFARMFYNILFSCIFIEYLIINSGAVLKEQERRRSHWFSVHAADQLRRGNDHIDEQICSRSNDHNAIRVAHVGLCFGSIVSRIVLVHICHFTHHLLLDCCAMEIGWRMFAHFVIL